MMNKRIISREHGITLVALVVTIIVLLILAGITIQLVLGQNGIIHRAGDARDETIVGQEKEQVELAYVSAAVKKLGSDVDKDDLQDELDISVGENKTKVTGSDILKVKFEDTKHVYKVSKAGEVSKVDSNSNTWTYNHSAQTVSTTLYNGTTLTLNIGDYIIDTDEQTIEGFDGYWRVLGVEDEQLLLTSNTGSAPFTSSDVTLPGASLYNEGGTIYLQLTGTDGYNNGVAVLNAIGAKFNNSKLENGRSINIDDVNTITGYNPNNTGVNDYLQTGTGRKFGEGKSYQYGLHITYKIINGKVNSSTNYNQDNPASATWVQWTYPGYDYSQYFPFGSYTSISGDDVSSVDVDDYYYDAETLTDISTDNKPGILSTSAAYDMLFGNCESDYYYYLASQCVFGNTFYSAYGLRTVVGWEIDRMELWDSYEKENTESVGVRPAILLKSNIVPEFVKNINDTEIDIYKIGSGTANTTAIENTYNE